MRYFNILGHATDICATCGGDSVCFINCNTGVVMKKYKQPQEVTFRVLHLMSLSSQTLICLGMAKIRFPLTFDHLAFSCLPTEYL